MSIFARKNDSEPPAESHKPAPTATATATAAAAAAKGSTGRYGIADAITLMRSLPVDQNADLVVRVVRATLGSLNVRVEDIIEDAARKQKGIQESITSLHTQVADLEKELANRRREIAALEAELKETTSVKDRLQLAERPGGLPPALFGSSSGTPPGGSLFAPVSPAGKLPGPKLPDRDEPTTAKE